MFSTNLTTSGGTQFLLQRRERPGLVFDPQTGKPVTLLNGASAHDAAGLYRAFSLLQEINH